MLFWRSRSAFAVEPERSIGVALPVPRGSSATLPSAVRSTWTLVAAAVDVAAAARISFGSESSLTELP